MGKCDLVSTYCFALYLSILGNRSTYFFVIANFGYKTDICEKKKLASQLMSASSTDNSSDKTVIMEHDETST